MPWGLSTHLEVDLKWGRTAGVVYVWECVCQQCRRFLDPGCCGAMLSLFGNPVAGILRGNSETSVYVGVEATTMAK